MILWNTDQDNYNSNNDNILNKNTLYNHLNNKSNHSHHNHHDNSGDNDTVHFILANGFIILFLSLCVICILTQIRNSRGEPYMIPTEEEVNEIETCPICLEDLDGVENSVRIRICSHVLCSACGNRLLDNNIHNCPVCRRHFYIPEHQQR